jgi:transposase
MDNTTFIGIDIAKDKIDIAIHLQSFKGTFSNNIKGFTEMAKALEAQLQHAFVVLEATGGYEKALLEWLLARNIPVHRAAPRTAKEYARSLRLFTKNDALDATALARFGAERHEELPVYLLPDAQTAILQKLLTRRADMVAMLKAEKQRSQHPLYQDALQDYLQRSIAFMKDELIIIEQRVNEIIAQSEILQAKKKVLMELPGVGDKVANVLLMLMPELGQIDGKKIASLAGVAPHAKESGKKIGYRQTIGGRQEVRRLLFLAAMAARKAKESVFREFFERLVAAGKKPMVALVAVMRKLLVVANARIRDAFYKLQQPLSIHNII